MLDSDSGTRIKVFWTARPLGRVKICIETIVAATAISQRIAHSRVPLIEGNRALKGLLLRDLIAKRHGPDDRKRDRLCFRILSMVERHRSAGIQDSI